MNTALLLRGLSSDSGTFGTLSCNADGERLVVFMTELPWRNNIKQYSCIPKGQYVCTWIRSPKFGYCYTVTNVVNRGNILIHSGNYVGDSKKGLRTHSHGCLLPASRLGVLAGQAAGLASFHALRRLNAFFKHKDFMLIIKDIQ